MRTPDKLQPGHGERRKLSPERTRYGHLVVAVMVVIVAIGAGALSESIAELKEKFGL